MCRPRGRSRETDADTGGPVTPGAAAEFHGRTGGGFGRCTHVVVVALAALREERYRVGTEVQQLRWVGVHRVELLGRRHARGARGAALAVAHARSRPRDGGDAAPGVGTRGSLALCGVTKTAIYRPKNIGLREDRARGGQGIDAGGLMRTVLHVTRRRGDKRRGESLFGGRSRGMRACGDARIARGGGTRRTSTVTRRPLCSGFAE